MLQTLRLSGVNAKSFSELLKSLLEENGWDIGELAGKVGIHRNTLSKHVNGIDFPHRSTRKLYAQAFGIDPDEFERMYRQTPAWVAQHDRLNLIPTLTANPQTVIKDLEKLDDAGLRAVAAALPLDVWPEPEKGPPGKPPSALLLNHQVDAILQARDADTLASVFREVLAQVRKRK